MPNEPADLSHDNQVNPDRCNCHIYDIETDPTKTINPSNLTISVDSVSVLPSVSVQMVLLRTPGILPNAPAGGN